MQIAIAKELSLEVNTVSNFFMNARRRSRDKWLDDSGNNNRISGDDEMAGSPNGSINSLDSDGMSPPPQMTHPQAPIVGGTVVPGGGESVDMLDAAFIKTEDEANSSYVTTPAPDVSSVTSQTNVALLAAAAAQQQLVTQAQAQLMAAQQQQTTSQPTSINPQQPLTSLVSQVMTSMTSQSTPPNLIMTSQQQQQQQQNLIMAAAAVSQHQQPAALSAVTPSSVADIQVTGETYVSNAEDLTPTYVKAENQIKTELYDM